MDRSTHKQLDYQLKVIEKNGYAPDQFVNIGHTWWQNPTNHNSMRLTFPGFKWMRQHGKVVFHKIELAKGIHILPKQLLQLERQFTEPYYIQSTNVIFVSKEEDAIMLQLHAGNIQNYLDSLQNYRL